MDALNTVEANLPPIVITDEERSSFNAISVDNKIFVDEVINELQNNPNLNLDGFFNPAFIVNDRDLFEQAETIESRMENVLNLVRDIKRMVGHESYGSGTGTYGMIAVMARNGMLGAQESYERLKARFAGQGGNGRPEGEPTP
jgi:glycerol-3-phosphate cytidylyltransferase-like family protein